MEIAGAATGVQTSRIIEQVARVRDQDAAHQIEMLNAAGRREVEKMERGLIVLEIVANISPLIGLLGTVLGMVDWRAFDRRDVSLRHAPRDYGVARSGRA